MKKEQRCSECGGVLTLPPNKPREFAEAILHKIDQYGLLAESYSRDGYESLVDYLAKELTNHRRSVLEEATRLVCLDCAKGDVPVEEAPGNYYHRRYEATEYFCEASAIHAELKADKGVQT